MAELTGKGVWTWQLLRCEGGDPARIARRAGEAGLSHVLIKIADGTASYGDAGRNRDVAAALRERGVAPWGWHYVYGANPAAEAITAIAQVQALDLAGYVIDAETQYKAHPQRAAQARTFVAVLRAGLPHTPVALSSYRFPTLHAALPWREFLEGCNYNMPQVYWEQAHNPAAQLRRSVQELAALAPARPVVPAGAAYGVGAWEATPADVIEFLGEARALGLAGASLYSWDWAGAPDKAALWNAIANFDWPVEEPMEITAIVNLVRGDDSDALRLLGELQARPDVIVTALQRIELPDLPNLPPLPPPEPQPLWQGRVVGDLVIRDRDGARLGVMTAGSQVLDVWAEGNAGNYTERVFYTPVKNENVWGRYVVRIGTGGGGDGLVLLWPVEAVAVNQFFGARPDYYKQFNLDGHEGLDARAALGAPVWAAAAGTVTNVIADGPQSLYGNNVRVLHLAGGRRFKTVYAHLSRMLVQAGQQVQAGERIGEAGSTGNSSGPHLHFGVYEQDAAGNRLNAGNGFAGYFDPLPFMRART